MVKDKFGLSFNKTERKIIAEYYKEIVKLPVGSEESLFVMFKPNMHTVDPIEKLFTKDYPVPVTFFYG